MKSLRPRDIYSCSRKEFAEYCRKWKVRPIALRQAQPGDMWVPVGMQNPPILAVYHTVGTYVIVVPL